MVCPGSERESCASCGDWERWCICNAVRSNTSHPLVSGTPVVHWPVCAALWATLVFGCFIPYPSSRAQTSLKGGGVCATSSRTQLSSFPSLSEAHPDKKDAVVTLRLRKLRLFRLNSLPKASRLICSPTGIWIQSFKISKPGIFPANHGKIKESDMIDYGDL